MEATTTLSSLEDRRCAAMVEADLHALSDLFDDDLIWTHASAQVDTKKSFLVALADRSTRYVEIKRLDEVVRLHGNVAVITGIADMLVELSGDRRPFRNRYTNVWARRNGEWKMMASQSTSSSPQPAETS